MRTMHLPSLLRRRLWRTACGLAGGLTVTGRLPRPSADGRGRIVVANHSSHADTAVLMAGLPIHGKPVFAAAADYWFDIWWRRALVTSLAGALPVRRNKRGAYAALLDAARPAIADGRTVVIYPEGTRTEDGSVGQFASGASRLAFDLGVEVVPVALLGTREVLPKHGNFRPAPMELRIGTPLRSGDCDAYRLRAEVELLRSAAPVAEPTSPVWRALSELVGRPTGPVLAFGWGFAEAVSWPVMAEMSLVFFATARPQRIPGFSAALIVGSVAGVLTTTIAARRGRTLAAPWTTERMNATARSHLADGPRGILRQALNGVPVKVYARQAGVSGVPVLPLIGWTTIERGLRLAVIAAGLKPVADLAHPMLRRHYGVYLLATGAGFTVVLRRIVRAWN